MDNLNTHALDRTVPTVCFYKFDADPGKPLLYGRYHFYKSYRLVEIGGVIPRVGEHIHLVGEGDADTVRRVRNVVYNYENNTIHIRLNELRTI